MRESTLLSSTLSRNPALQQVSNQVLCEGVGGILSVDWTTGLDYWTDHFYHLSSHWCKVKVMCRKLGRAILFWLKVFIHC